jgi:hypothetical protein
MLTSDESSHAPCRVIVHVDLDCFYCARPSCFAAPADSLLLDATCSTAGDVQDGCMNYIVMFATCGGAMSQPVHPAGPWSGPVLAHPLSESTHTAGCPVWVARSAGPTSACRSSGAEAAGHSQRHAMRRAAVGWAHSCQLCSAGSRCHEAHACARSSQSVPRATVSARGGAGCAAHPLQHVYPIAMYALHIMHTLHTFCIHCIMQRAACVPSAHSWMSSNSVVLLVTRLLGRR